MEATLTETLKLARKIHAEHGRYWGQLVTDLWWRAQTLASDGFATWSNKNPGNIAYSKDGRAVNARFSVWLKHLYRMHVGNMNANPNDYEESVMGEMAEMFGRAKDLLSTPPTLKLTDDGWEIRHTYSRIRSCMSEMVELLEFYVRNKHLFKLLVALKADRPVGRAIVATATLPDGETVQVLDRVYVSETEHRKLFGEFATKHGYYQRVEHYAENAPTIVDADGKGVDPWQLKVRLGDNPEGYYPYMDTWAYLYRDNDGTCVLGARPPAERRYLHIRNPDGCYVGPGDI